MKKWNFLGHDIEVVEDDDIPEVYANTAGVIPLIVSRVTDTDKSLWNARMHMECYMTRCAICAKAVWIDPISVLKCHEALPICTVCFMNETNHPIMEHLLASRRSSSE